jgi:hypothetical protein
MQYEISTGAGIGATPARPGELTADHPVPLVLGGEPLPARPGDGEA